jgi:anaerobic sulfite reductase subunit B
MLNHIPDSIELVDYIDDGEQSRHFRFRLLHLTKSQLHNWQQVQPGQFFMLNVPSVGEAPFTFTQMPNKQGEFRAFIRKMGQVTSHLFTMKSGDILGARGPFGRGWPLDKINSSNTLIVAGGCGLAPLVTAIDNLIENNKTNFLQNQVHNQENKQQLVLVYGARNKAAQLLTPERARWQKHINIFNTLDDYEGETCSKTVQGSPLTILSEAISAFIKPPTTALLCGPEVMMNNVASYLTQYGIASNSIFFAVERRMHCAVGLCGHCYINNQYVCKNGPTFSWQELQQLTN